MGMPARKLESNSHRERRTTPRLRVARPRSAKRVSRGDQLAAARRTFTSFVILTVVVCALGLGRVWLSVQAAEASLDSGRLMSEIKAERYRGDMLEIQQSALSSPSRIRAIAGATMDMTSAGRVTYIDLADGPAVAKQDVPDRPSPLKQALGDVLSLAAGEAQVLLVGDVGLATAR